MDLIRQGKTLLVEVKDKNGLYEYFATLVRRVKGMGRLDILTIREEREWIPSEKVPGLVREVLNRYFFRKGNEAVRIPFFTFCQREKALPRPMIVYADGEAYKGYFIGISAWFNGKGYPRVGGYWGATEDGKVIVVMETKLVNWKEAPPYGSLPIDRPQGE